MKKFLLYTTLLALCPLLLFAQAPDTLWTRTYGGTENDVGNSIKQTSDGGYIIAGYTESFGDGGKDVWLLKTDANGDTVWTKTYGGSNDDWATAVGLTSDGGYIILANTEELYGSVIWLIKTDNVGDTTWTKIYDIPDGLGYDVNQTSDGGYIITGGTEQGHSIQHLLLLKTDANGDMVWCRYLDYGEETAGFSVCETFDGGYIIGGGITYTGVEWNHILLKTDVNGDELWRAVWPTGPTGIRSVRQTTDSGYVACGGWGVWIVRTDVYGNTSWMHGYGDWCEAGGYSLQITNDDAYIFTGECRHCTQNYDIFLIKTDENGDSLWCAIYGRIGDDGGRDVQQTNDGGYIIVGFSHSDVYLIKTEPDLGIEENESAIVTNKGITATIFSGPLPLPEGRKCKVFDITGRVVEPNRIQPGIYFIEVDGQITQKVVKVR